METEMNKGMQEKEPKLRALGVDVNGQGVVHVIPVGYRDGDKIKPATEVDESLQTFDVKAVDMDVNNNHALQQMGLTDAQVKGLQHAVDGRYTRRAINERNNRAQRLQSQSQGVEK